jgi:hypothetical protein
MACLLEGFPVTAYKRFLLFSAFAAVVFLGSATPTQAQGRYRGRGPGRAVVVVGGYYADPYWMYDGWYDQYPWGPYRYPYRYYNIDPGAAVRLEVKPREAEVYVDGYYAGIVDDFDGVFQRLRVTPGEHEIELYLDGYRAVHQNVYLPVNDTFRIRYTMERLAAGQQPEPRPQPINPPPMAQGGQPPMPPGSQPPMPPGGQPPMGRGPMGRRMPPPQQPPDGPRGGQAGGYGTLTIRVQPGDAEVSIDGEAWRGPDGRDRLVVEVAEGSHTVEIRKAGYRTYVTQVEVRRGDTTPLNVSLRSQEEQGGGPARRARPRSSC